MRNAGPTSQLIHECMNHLKVQLFFPKAGSTCQLARFTWSPAGRLATSVGTRSGEKFWPGHGRDLETAVGVKYLAVQFSDIAIWCFSACDQAGPISLYVTYHVYTYIYTTYIINISYMYMYNIYMYICICIFVYVYVYLCVYV